MSKSTSNNDPTNKHKPPPPESDRRIICTCCHQYNLPCNYFPGESQCDTCFSLGQPCIPYDYDGSSSNNVATTSTTTNNYNNTHHLGGAAVAMGTTPASLSSYNQLVAQSYNSANNQNPESPRYTAAHHLRSHYGTIPPQQWPQQHHYNRGLPSTTAAAAAAALSQQYPHNSLYTNPPTAATTVNTITPYNNNITTQQQPHHRTNHEIIQSFATARYAARALNGGIEPTNPQIVEMMELMHSSTSGGGGGGGGGGGSGNSSRQPSLPPDTTQGAANTPSSQPPKAKRQRLQKQQQQQPHFATGTILPNYNSIIPSAKTKGGVKWISSKNVVDNITRRVRDECAYLCLLPTEDFVTQHEGGEESSNSSSSSRRRGKSSSQWLRCAVTLIYSLLNLESPNPVGWDDETTTTTAGKRNKHWLKGIYHKLHGPQPWQCTRPIIVKAVYQLLLAEGYNDWLLSEYRWKEFEKVIRPMIVSNLIAWKSHIFVKGSDVVEKYSKLVWERFLVDQLRPLKDYEEALVPPQIGFAYVCNVANSEDWSILGKANEEEEKSSAVMKGNEETSPSTSVDASSDLCLPVSEGKWESKWNCDYCPASFSVYDEAVAHENECKTKSQAAEAATEEDSMIREGPDTEEKIGKGDCVVESNVESAVEESSIYDEPVAHKNACKANAQALGIANEIEVNTGRCDEDVEAWKCDYCSATFILHDEAVAHENECKTKFQEGEEVKKEKEVADVNGKDAETNRRRVEGSDGFIVQEQWKCDYCSAQFTAFDDAVSHENECKAKIHSAAAVDGTTDEEHQASDEFAAQKVVDKVEKGWQCAYCEECFSVFDEAASHEAECKRSSKVATSSPTKISVSKRGADDAAPDGGYLDGVDGKDFSPSDELRSNMLKTLEVLHYEYFPLMNSGDENLGEVCDKVLRSIHIVTPNIKEHDVTSKWRVERVLNHLEQRSGYLSTLNGIFRVRVSTTALTNDKSNRESPTEAVGNMQSESEVLKATLVANGLDFVAAISSKGAAEEVATKSRMPCEECILCNAPDCERCFACLSKGRTETEICIRKSCCKLPFEDKAKPLVGFPPDWQYVFCDPNQGLLVKTPRRILSLAGLIIRRPLSAGFRAPRYQYFHSFEAAFAAAQHRDTRKATDSIESFLSHVHGSDAMKSHPKHLLVGKRFCFEFTNVNGVNVVMYGVISACFRESSGAETDVFMIQYDLDCIEIASKSLGLNILRLQLISSEQAWGGCVSFERKARIRGWQSIVRSIDQATAVEYWVTPDMRMEEMVEQDDGIQVPMLTMILRGYKLVFSAHHDDEGTTVTVTCVSMNFDDRQNGYEPILKPGELIDLGIFCPLSDSDAKPLPAFILKNYIHNFSINCSAGDGNGNVFDLTDDMKGTMNPIAMKKVLSYVRSSDEAEVPTIHGGLDPAGKVHLLFGVRYRGDWDEYTSIMDSEIQPIFSGQQKEVTLARNVLTNEQQEARYFSAMKNFGTEELVQCENFFRSIIASPTVVSSSGMKKRLHEVATCLHQRIAELGDPSLDVVDHFIQLAIKESR